MDNKKNDLALASWGVLAALVTWFATNHLLPSVEKIDKMATKEALEKVERRVRAQEKYTTAHAEYEKWQSKLIQEQGKQIAELMRSRRTRGPQQSQSDVRAGLQSLYYPTSLILPRR